ncbi:hypothetical protein SAMN05216420_102171 [Nitrosospira sp. Nl5]|uniref:hypothetical protein n=1 Tax=Nitrosospira sp. Nl5 TaxID=200120 RepID=UPI0008834A30|nr:hypothetical protein [Nitrosospira sp. Nl5]SCY06446.1 hypothetical protein SAMN05216420_102171 [Nitrosospira sp. Nl5]
MKGNDRVATRGSVSDTASPDPDGKEASVKDMEPGERQDMEPGERRQGATRSRTERRDPHSVRAGNPDRRNPDRSDV